MSVDNELRAGLADWRRHAVAASITLIPVAIAAAVAWGTLTSKVQAVETKTAGFDERLRTVEQSNSVVLSTLTDIRTQQRDMGRKIDQLYLRAIQ